MQSSLPMNLSRRCGARTRNGKRCRSPAMPNGRCRMHGGLSPGPPKGNKNAFKHGRYCAEAVARRRSIAELIKKARELAATRNLGTVSSSIFDLKTLITEPVRGSVSSCQVERYTAPVVPSSVGRFVLKRALVFALGKPGCQCFPMLGPGQSKKNSVSSALPSNSDIARSNRHFAFVRTGDSRSAAVTRLIQSACRRAVGMILVS